VVALRLRARPIAGSVELDQLEALAVAFELRGARSRGGAE
jgi:hypothetical protein